MNQNTATEKQTGYPGSVPTDQTTQKPVSPESIAELSALLEDDPERNSAAAQDVTDLADNSGQTVPDLNRCFKDGIFRIVFREKENLLSLYNAISGTDYDNPEALIIYTLEDAVYMGIRNDAGFLLHTQLGLYEHQSTLCYNMPLRGLQYFAAMYRAYVKANGYDPHRRKVIPLPVPQYIVFYNGEEKRRESWEMKLSDAFLLPEGQETSGRNTLLSSLAAPGAPALECTALVLNINYGKNRELMEKCRKLGEYAQFVACMRRHMKGKTTEKEKLEAVNTAVDECIRKGILKDILIKNRAEVVAMSFWEYDAERHLKIEKEDSYNDGFQDGIKSEKKNTLRERKRADAAENRANAAENRANTAENRANVAENRANTAENRADAAEQKLAQLQEELRILRGQLASGK